MSELAVSAPSSFAKQRLWRRQMAIIAWLCGIMLVGSGQLWAAETKPRKVAIAVAAIKARRRPAARILKQVEKTAKNSLESAAHQVAPLSGHKGKDMSACLLSDDCLHQLFGASQADDLMLLQVQRKRRRYIVHARMWSPKATSAPKSAVMRGPAKLRKQLPKLLIDVMASYRTALLELALKEERARAKELVAKAKAEDEARAQAAAVAKQAEMKQPKAKTTAVKPMTDVAAGGQAATAAIAMASGEMASGPELEVTNQITQTDKKKHLDADNQQFSFKPSTGLTLGLSAAAVPLSRAEGNIFIKDANRRLSPASQAVGLGVFASWWLGYLPWRDLYGTIDIQTLDVAPLKGTLFELGASRRFTRELYYTSAGISYSATNLALPISDGPLVGDIGWAKATMHAFETFVTLEIDDPRSPLTIAARLGYRQALGSVDEFSTANGIGWSVDQLPDEADEGTTQDSAEESSVDMPPVTISGSGATFKLMLGYRL